MKLIGKKRWVWFVVDIIGIIMNILFYILVRDWFFFIPIILFGIAAILCIYASYIDKKEQELQLYLNIISEVKK